MDAQSQSRNSVGSRTLAGGPPAWDDVPEEDAAKRQANRERIARGKPAACVSTDPTIADTRRSKWKSRERALKAALEQRQVTRRD